MTLTLIAIAASVLGGWVTLKLLGNERQCRLNHLEHRHQSRLYRDLMEVKERGQI